MVGATTIVWSPDGETIAVGSSDGLWFFDEAFNVVGYVAIPQFEGFPPTTMDWSADGSLIAMAINGFRIITIKMVVSTMTFQS